SPVSIAEISTAIQSEVAEYTRPFDASYARALGQAVQHAVDTFIDRVAHPGTPMAAILTEFRGIGAAEAREGRSLEPLQAALRLGARVGWRRLCAIAAEQGLDALALGRAGEAIFVYLDELADASAQGYLEARAEFAGERERRRRRLLDLILADPPAPAETVAEAARAAGWPLPTQVSVVVLGEPHHADTPALPDHVLADWSRQQPCLLIPDPDGAGQLAAVARALAGWSAAAGPAEPLARAVASLRWARRALHLADRGIIRDRGPAGYNTDGYRPDRPAPGPRGLIRCDEHLASLMIFGDEELTRTLCAARLAPLQRLRPAQRDRLAGTLLIWLQHGCNANEVAARLHVHPQTVRYRLRQVDDLFGDQLRDPDRRFELEIALRARQMLTRPS
ncbi:MAG TPA: helix-turn-helix domain-containing protein, partial [Streptosporangiaceae bacterium]|nr:helix-turn-helix domain-containing protein [Streptosporangiaceae bacterium]